MNKFHPARRVSVVNGKKKPCTGTVVRELRSCFRHSIAVPAVAADPVPELNARQQRTGWPFSSMDLSTSVNFWGSLRTIRCSGTM